MDASWVVCSICAGFPEEIEGGCICKDGSHAGEVDGLRLCAHDAQKKLASAQAEIERLREENAALREDKERLDYLDGEDYREECWRDAGMVSGSPDSLFRKNMPITRESIDAARARLGGG